MYVCCKDKDVRIGELELNDDEEHPIAVGGCYRCNEGLHRLSYYILSYPSGLLILPRDPYL